MLLLHLFEIARCAPPLGEASLVLRCFYETNVLDASGATDRPLTLCFSIRLATRPDFLAFSTNSAM